MRLLQAKLFEATKAPELCPCKLAQCDAERTAALAFAEGDAFLQKKTLDLLDTL